MHQKKILLIHLFSNGDCLYATTIAKQIKADFPDSWLTWAISSQCKEIIKNNPFVDEVKEIPMPAGIDKDQCHQELVLEMTKQKQQGKYDLVFNTQVIGDNWANYDSCVRTSIYRCYGKPITVDKRPVLVLTSEEVAKAEQFAAVHRLSDFKHVVLYECAPLSGQAKFSDEFVMELARIVVTNPGTAIILSSAKTYLIQLPGILDGSQLTIRETVALAHHCNLMIGCSSGITWAVSSQPDLKLPSVQLLAKDAYVYNPPSIAKSKVGEETGDLIELFDYDLNLIGDCISEIFAHGFNIAHANFNQPAKKQFRLYRGITHDLIRRGKIRLLKYFVTMNLKEHHWHPKMIISILKGIILYPIQSSINSKK